MERHECRTIDTSYVQKGSESNLTLTVDREKERDRVEEREDVMIGRLRNKRNW